ncbi:MAG: hypothetical protein N2444_01355 [Methylocystis sp.]|nr:hypothetical protein [Methylocystis sp.]
MRTLVLLCAAPVFTAPACAKEIHLDCARSNQAAMVDIDAGRAFLQIMWGDGIAEAFKLRDSCIDGPDNAGRREKVVYVMSVDGASVAVLARRPTPPGRKF